MLLSVERPFVGAFAIRGPGATLLYCSGLVQSVLPASDWNIANGQSRFPRNLGEPCLFLNGLPDGDTGLPTPGPAVHSSARERTQRVNVEVPPSEGNEARWDDGRAS